MSAVSTTEKQKVEFAIKQFSAAMADSANAIATAGRIYYEAIKDHPSARQAFAQAMPGIPSALWANLARVGSGALNAKLLTDCTPGARALCYCDPETQSRYIAEPVAVAVGGGDKMLIATDKLTSEQVRQVFHNGAVRDLAEQRAWIETQKTRAAIQKPTVDPVNDIYVEKGVLHIGTVKLTRKELLKYLQQMEA